MRIARHIVTAIAVLTTAGCAGLLRPTATAPGDLTAIAGWKGAAPNSAHAFRFVVIGDRTGGHREGAWATAITEINRLKPDFVLCVGDLIEGYTEDKDRLEQQWDEFDNLTAKFDAPFFYCAGNHDVLGTAPREVYTARHGIAGRAYYSFDYRNSHFVVLDSDAIDTGLRDIVTAQWAWLEQDLAAARGADHVFILHHHPLYSSPEWTKMRKMIDPTKTTIFTGHLHRLSYDVEDGVPYYVLASTATNSPNDRKRGAFLSYAHVAMDRGEPTISIIPVGEVLPHDIINRHLTDVMAAMIAGVQLTPTTSAGGEVALHLVGPTEGQATLTLTWTADDRWFADGLPATETLTLTPGQTISRKHRINASDPQATPPVLELAYALTVDDRTVEQSATLPLPVIALLDVRRADGLAIDGDLTDWANVATIPTISSHRVTYRPEQWTGPDDCSMTTQLAYDDSALYLAVDVTDDELLTQGAMFWQRDGIEIFWDPRPVGQRTSAFRGDCRHLGIPLPAEGQDMDVTALPAGSIEPDALRIACVRRPGGFVVELAIPFDAIASGFAPSPDVPLFLEVMINDMDTVGDNTRLSNMVLSGDDNASRRTSGYAKLTFVAD